jgi:hypothetical protein
MIIINTEAISTTAEIPTTKTVAPAITGKTTNQLQNNYNKNIGARRP